MKASIQPVASQPAAAPAAGHQVAKPAAPVISRNNATTQQVAKRVLQSSRCEECVTAVWLWGTCIPCSILLCDRNMDGIFACCPSLNPCKAKPE